jgi:hypothetical protein
MRFGAAVPWFESLGLKTLFGISLIKKTVPNQPTDPPSETPALSQ